MVAKHEEAWAVSGCRLTTIPDAYTLCEPWEVMQSLRTSVFGKLRVMAFSLKVT